MTGTLLISCKAWLGRFLRRFLRVPAEYLVRPQLREGFLLEAYRGLVHQAYLSPSFQPQLSDQVFWKGQWRPWQGLPQQNHLLHGKEIMLFIITAMMLS